MKFIPYAHQSIDASDIEHVAESLKQDWITRGPQVEAFEKAVAAYCGAKYGVAFNSGTSALMAATFAGKVNGHDRLLTTPNTFVASVGCATALGATPIFLDIDRTTGNFNLDQLKINLQKKHSRGRDLIMAVHFAGLPIDMQAIDRMILDPQALVIEDAAHALGSHYPDGQKVGSCTWSQMTIFSFHPAKTITTGEGGIVTTNDEELYNRLKMFLNNGRSIPSLEVEEITGNYHLTEMQAALGLSQLKRLEAFISKRRELIKLYRELLQGMPHVELFTSEYDERTAFHLCVVQIDFHAYGKTRNQVMALLKEKGIGTQVHYIPVYQHPHYRRLCGDLSPYFPDMETYYARTLSLPLYYDLAPEDVERVVASLKEALSK